MLSREVNISLELGRDVPDTAEVPSARLWVQDPSHLAYPVQLCGIPRILRGTPFSLCRSSPLLTSVSDPAHADNSIK